MGKRRKNLLVYICLLAFIFSYLVAGQAGRGKGRLNGTVVDEEGKPVVGAKVVIQFTREKGIEWSTTTNKKGEWAFLGLGSGLWLITVTAEGYLPAFKEVNVSQIEANPKVTISLKKVAPLVGSEADKESIKMLDQAATLFNEKKFDEAISILKEFIAKNPEFYPALINLAECYREKGDYDQAIEFYQQAITESKKDDRWAKEVVAKALSGIGECYLRKGDLDQAQNYFKQAVDFSPDNEMVAYNVGELYFSNQKLDEAIHYFSLAIKIKPDWALPYYKLGLVYLNKNDFDLAKENLKKFLNLDPNSELAPTAKNILEYLDKIKK